MESTVGVGKDKAVSVKDNGRGCLIGTSSSASTGVAKSSEGIVDAVEMEWPASSPVTVFGSDAIFVDGDV